MVSAYSTLGLNTGWGLSRVKPVYMDNKESMLIHVKSLVMDI